MGHWNWEDFSFAYSTNEFEYSYYKCISQDAEKTKNIYTQF